MQCPKCKFNDSKVLESRDANNSVRRRRECLRCGARYTTYERIEHPNLAVIKSDGRKVLFDRQKLYTAIQRSVGKTLDTETEVEEIVSNVENQLYSMGETEYASSVIGDLVMEDLAHRNEVAYVRFASVYKKFNSADEFAKTLSDLRERLSREKAK